VAGLGAVVMIVAALRGPARLGELEVIRRSRDLEARVESGLIQVERGAVTLADPTSGITIEAGDQAALRRDAGGVRVVRGRFDFVVAHRRTGAPPAIVFVSHGAIEVMGTAFTVVQGTAGGEVRLREGSIRFRGSGGAVVPLRPGESLSWPLPAPAASAGEAEMVPARPPTTPERVAPPPEATRAASSPSRPASRSPSAAAPRSAEELLDHIEELRSRHQYAAAARALRDAIPTQPPSTRERLSFELGSLLTHQLRDPARACAHWRWHQGQFDGGRYREEVARAERALGCGGTGDRAPGAP
jgi:transmembrane sensor